MTADEAIEYLIKQYGHAYVVGALSSIVTGWAWGCEKIVEHAVMVKAGAQRAQESKENTPRDGS